jgi:hypothetical protein
MSKTVQVLQSQKLRFPNYCVYCCEPATGHKEVHVTATFTKVRIGPNIQEHYGANLSVPYCGKHLEEMEKVAKIGEGFKNAAAALGFFLGIAWFILQLRADNLVVDEWWEYLLRPLGAGLAGGIIVGLAGIFFGMFILYPVFAVFSRTIRHNSPFFIFDFLKGRSMGFKANIDKGEEVVLCLKFFNSSYATRFVEANPGATLDRLWF